MAVTPYVPAGVGLVRGAAGAAKAASDLLKLVQGVQWTERFAGAGPEVMKGIQHLEKLVNHSNVHERFRRGYAAELLRAEQLHKAGKLQGVEVRVGRGRVDFVLITDELVEFKYWRESYAQGHIEDLLNQLKEYQASGRGLILEFGRTKRNPVTEKFIEKLLEAAKRKKIPLTREQIRIIDLE